MCVRVSHNSCQWYVRTNGYITQWIFSEHSFKEMSWKWAFSRHVHPSHDKRLWGLNKCVYGPDDASLVQNVRETKLQTGGKTSQVEPAVLYCLDKDSNVAGLLVCPVDGFHLGWLTQSPVTSNPSPARCLRKHGICHCKWTNMLMSCMHTPLFYSSSTTQSTLQPRFWFTHSPGCLQRPTMRCSSEAETDDLRSKIVNPHTLSWVDQISCLTRVSSQQTWNMLLCKLFSKQIGWRESWIRTSDPQVEEPGKRQITKAKCSATLQLETVPMAAHKVTSHCADGKGRQILTCLLAVKKDQKSAADARDDQDMSHPHVTKTDCWWPDVSGSPVSSHPGCEPDGLYFPQPVGWIPRTPASPENGFAFDLNLIQREQVDILISIVCLGRCCQVQSYTVS